MKFNYIKKNPQTYMASSLMKLLDNSKLSIIDLLIRESVQNSFDASKSNVNHINYKISVNSFFTKDFFNVFNDLEKCIGYNHDSAECIVIQDSNTTGLDGLYDNGKINYYSNYYKLIYDNGNPQNKENSGGSWGYGKTIFYQLGIGIVLYYTRTVNNGQYESSIIMNVIEDEKKDNSILNRMQCIDNVGIGYWGSEYNDDNNIILPIIDKKEISNILRIFDIQEYKEGETGTTIIIPFINTNSILSDYKSHCLNEQLDSSIDIITVIKDTIARWYILKLSNKNYLKFINFYVNNELLDYNRVRSSFRVLQELYNSRFKESENSGVELREVKIRTLLTDTLAGYLIFKKYSMKELNMLRPINEHSPYYYYNVSNGDENDGKNNPIIAYCRKPGMIISYETDYEWLKSVPPTNFNEFLIAIFVLNSENFVKKQNISLEEYVRKGEWSNHNSWQDYNSENIVIKKIKNKVNTILKNEFKLYNDDNELVNTSMGQYYAKYFLPPLGFGNLSSVKTKQKSIKSKNRNKLFLDNCIMNYEIVDLKKDIIVFLFKIEYKKVFDDIKLFLAIMSKPNNIKKQEWDDVSKYEFPFDILSSKVIDNSCNIESNSSENSIIINNKNKNESISFKLNVKIKDNKYSPVFMKG